MNSESGNETLDDLVALYRAESGPYSREFLAAEICRELGRLQRLRDAYGVGDTSEEAVGIQAAETLLRQDMSLVENALRAVAPKHVVEAFEDYIKTHPIGDSEDAGLRLLFTVDGLGLIAAVADQVQPPRTSARMLGVLRSSLSQIERLIGRHLVSFAPAAPAINSYCLDWGVEKGPLTRIAEISSPWLDALAAEPERTPVLPPASSAECLDENVVVSIARGRRVAEPARTHLAACLHCAALVSAAIRDLRRSPAIQESVPLWEGVVAAAISTFEWVILKGATVVERAARAPTAWPDFAPVLARASTRRRGTMVSGVLVDRHGRTLRRISAEITVFRRLQRGMLQLELRLPDMPGLGKQAWAAIEVPGGRHLVLAGRIVGSRAVFRAVGPWGRQLRVRPDRMKVAILMQSRVEKRYSRWRIPESRSR